MKQPNQLNHLMQMSRKKKVVIDYKKLLLSKPDNLFELFAFIILLSCTFAFYFSPLVFSEITPLKAVTIAAIPSLISGWALFSLVRLLRFKSKYTK